MDVFLAQQDHLRRIAAGMGLTQNDSDDCLQDVSVTVLKQVKHFDTQQDCVRWIMRVTINRCLFEHRRKRSFLSKAAEIYRRQRKALPRSAANTAIVIEELDLVRQGLSTLDDTRLAPMLLRYFCGCDATNTNTSWTTTQRRVQVYKRGGKYSKKYFRNQTMKKPPKTIRNMKTFLYVNSASQCTGLRALRGEKPIHAEGMY
jgi:DNA-directed RNA polymerase specialized sigma24 family protein